MLRMCMLSQGVQGASALFKRVTMSQQGLLAFDPPLEQDGSDGSRLLRSQVRAASCADDEEVPRCVCACSEQQSCCTRYASHEFLNIKSEVAAASAESSDRDAVLRTAVNAQSENIEDLTAKVAGLRNAVAAQVEALVAQSRALASQGEALVRSRAEMAELRAYFAAVMFLVLMLA